MALDTLVVFGYGPVGAGGRLNVYARLAALAAGTLLESGAAKRLLITGGRTGGDALPSEAALMASCLARHVPVSPVALEQVVAARLLEELTKTPSYARLAAFQVRAMRGPAELPGFRLPPLGRLENPDRLRHVQGHPAVASLNLPADPDAFKNVLLKLPRRYPEPHPDDLRLGLEAARG